VDRAKQGEKKLWAARNGPLNAIPNSLAMTGGGRRRLRQWILNLAYRSELHTSPGLDFDVLLCVLGLDVDLLVCC
jgi:hypothetical protein